MKLLIGLGNPGAKYIMTRHNFGALFMNSLAESNNLSLIRHKTQALTARLHIDKSDILIATPLSFMNESGPTVAALKKYFKVSAQDIIIAYDDIDLYFGHIRISSNKSSGGHKGIQSILDTLGTDVFVRIRLGIAPQVGTAEKYVLKPWSAAQKKKLPHIIDNAKKGLEVLLSQGLDAAAQKFNKKNP
jgi:peptidyl-tRNA hydrolase, PTH1 family